MLDYRALYYKALLRISDHHDYKSWPSLQLVHEPPGDENDESEVISLIDQFCRKQGERISGVYLYEGKSRGSRLHSSLHVKNEDLTPMFFLKAGLFLA